MINLCWGGMESNQVGTAEFVDFARQTGDNRIRRGRVFQIADEPMVEISHLNSAEVMKTVEKPLLQDGVWNFPAASVSAVEVELA